MGFPGSSAVKESACNAGDPSSIPGLGRSPGEEIGYPLQYSWASLVSQMIIYFQCVRLGFNPWVGKIPWRRWWQPTPVFLPGESLWTEEPGRLQSMGLQRVLHKWATKHSTESICDSKKKHINDHCCFYNGYLCYYQLNRICTCYVQSFTPLSIMWDSYSY